MDELQLSVDAVQRWLFPVTHILPSCRDGLDAPKELYVRQQTACFIQDMGQRLHLNQLAINTAIVYMHRFYMIRSFTTFHQTPIAAACVLVASKAEEQPRKLVDVLWACKQVNARSRPPEPLSREEIRVQGDEMVTNENFLIATIGCDFTIRHPHTYILKHVKTLQLRKEVAQVCYIVATTTLHLTKFCVKWPSSSVAAMCVYLVTKWIASKLDRLKDGEVWCKCFDADLTPEAVHELTVAFLTELAKCPDDIRHRVLKSFSISNRATNDPNQLTEGNTAIRRVTAMLENFLTYYAVDVVSNSQGDLKVGDFLKDTSIEVILKPLLKRSRGHSVARTDRAKRGGLIKHEHNESNGLKSCTVSSALGISPTITKNEQSEELPPLASQDVEGGIKKPLHAGLELISPSTTSSFEETIASDNRDKIGVINGNVANGIHGNNLNSRPSSSEGFRPLACDGETGRPSCSRPPQRPPPGCNGHACCCNGHACCCYAYQQCGYRQYNLNLVRRQRAYQTLQTDMDSFHLGLLNSRARPPAYYRQCHARRY